MLDAIARLDANIARGVAAAAGSRAALATTHHAHDARAPPAPSTPALSRLHHLITCGTPLDLLQWAFHTLPPFLVQACQEGVQAEMVGEGLEAEDLELVACEALRAQACEAEWGLDAPLADIPPAALPHLCYRSDGSSRCEAEVLAILCGNLRAAAQAAATAEALCEEARAAAAAAAAAAEDEAAAPYTLARTGSRHASGSKGSTAAAAAAAAAAAPRCSVQPAQASGAASSAWQCATSHQAHAPGADFPSLLAVPYLAPRHSSAPRTSAHLAAAQAQAPPPRPAPPAALPALNPRAAALLAELHCACGGAAAARHSAACRSGLYAQLTARATELAGRRAALLRSASGAMREQPRRFGGAVAGSYAERAREVTSELKAAQELASHVMLLATNPGLQLGGGGSSGGGGSISLARAVQLATAEAAAAAAAGGGGGGGGGGGAEAEVDLHGQQLVGAVELLRGTVLPRARAAACRSLRIITGAGNHSGREGGGRLREGVGHFLRSHVGVGEAQGGWGITRCAAEGNGAFLVSFG